MKDIATVIIVEDNESMIFLLTELINGNPKLNVIDTAKDGQEALEKIQSQKPDIVIMDICLPMLDGLDVLKSLNENRESYFPKVIITSCMGLDEITKTAMNLGASYYIVKPFESKSFLAKLELMLEMDSAEVDKSEREIFIDKEGSSKSIQNKIVLVLHLMGMPPHTKGYVYLKEAIELVYLDTRYMKMTKHLYPELAERFNATASGVERAIRNTLDLTFERGEWEHLERIFSGQIQKGEKLTNSEFIAATVEYLKSDR